MNRLMSCRFAIYAIVVVIVLPAWSAGMDLVADGKAKAVIVVQEAPQNTRSAIKSRKPRTGDFQCKDSMAAKVLADWIEKISNVRPNIVNRPQAGKPAIFVGTAAINAGLDLSDMDSPTKEGLRILCDGKTRVLISGQNETSTVKAVCRFLEELGCRYFMDNPLGEVYPRSKTVTVGPA